MIGESHVWSIITHHHVKIMVKNIACQVANANLLLYGLDPGKVHNPHVGLLTAFDSEQYQGLRDSQPSVLISLLSNLYVQQKW